MKATCRPRAGCRSRSGWRSTSSRSRRKSSSRCWPPGARNAKRRRSAPCAPPRCSRTARAPTSPASSKASLAFPTKPNFLTAVRACWAALWTSHARRYMENADLSPADTAMGVLIQPLINARASGGGLSETAEGHMLISATWGLGSAIAQGEVVPDRIVLAKNGFLRTVQAGRKNHQDTCAHGVSAPQRVPKDMVSEPCLSAGQAVTLGRLLRKCEQLAGQPVEIEWAMDESGFKLLQSRPLHVEAPVVPDEIWLRHPGLSGHPAGIGWGSGRAVVVNCECELERVAPGDILITKVAGPALSAILPRVAGVVAELGGSTSHLGFAGARARHSHGARRARRHPAYSRRFAMRGRRRRRHRAVAAVSAQAAHLRHASRSPTARSSGCARSAASRSFPTTAASFRTARLSPPSRRPTSCSACCTTRSTRR